jgi:parvulin-like peptidyl-prolyl isomerase
MKSCLLFLLIIFGLSCSSREKDNSPVLARVNNQVLTVNSLNEFLPPENRTDEQVRGFIRGGVDNSVLYDAAIGAGFHRDKKIIEEKNSYFKKRVIAAYLQTSSLAKTKITNKQVRDYYDNHIESFRRLSSAATVNHFLVDNISDARLIVSKLSQKKTAKPIAELFSMFDVETKTVKRGMLIKELDGALFNKRIKSVIGPIQSARGYHVINVLKRHKIGSQLGLENVYDDIYQRLLAQHRAGVSSDILDSLKVKSKIFINTNYKQK